MSDAALEAVAALVARESGIELPSTRRAALQSAIRRTGVAGPEELLERLAGPGGSAVLSGLLDEVTVQETSLYRDAAQFDEIDWRALQTGAARAGRPVVRIWSAGCATGEEAYTLAMLACEAFGSLTPPVEIVGTDLSAAALAQAVVGRYSARRARTVPPAQRERHLSESGDTVAVRPALRRLVTFARHNLVADPAPPPGQAPFDLVVCRNVLIYFDPATAERVVASLRGALLPGGHLLLGAADQLGRSPRADVGAADGVPDRSRATPGPLPQEPLARAVAAADAGRADEALAQVDLVLEHDPLNASAYFLRGLVILPADPQSAVDSLRRALLIDPCFGLAAFQLGRAYDALGDADAARTAYVTALHTLDPDDSRYDELLRQVDLGDVATAIRVRIQGLR